MTVAVSVAVRMALEPWLGANAPYLLFFPAVVISGWNGGFGAGVAATLLSGLAVSLLPASGFTVSNPADVLSLALFVFTGCAIAWLQQERVSAKHAQQAASAESLSRAERLRLDEQLRASEARWRAIIDSAVDAIIVIDQSGRVEAFNPAAKRLFGYAETEVIGQNVNMLMPSPYHEEHDRYVARYLSTGQAKIIGIGREVIAKRKDGTTFPVHLSVGQFTLAGQRKFTGILHDLTARAQMEEQLRERAALAKVGEMAAVIAHEVRNPLAGIRGAIQAISAQQPSDSRHATLMKEIVARIDSLNDLMKDLLVFARPPKPRQAPTDIVPLVRMTASLLKEDPAFRGIHIDVEGAAPPVPADAEMLKIVFQNLLVNGAHAMSGQGHIRVEVKAIDSSCSIAFSDTGPGIAPDLRDKIFTPFFTTKSRGTGLGLPTAKRLVEAQNGQISIECPPAGGTKVVVTLPAAVVGN